MHTWIALFRGINVGGNNMLPMAKLKSDLESLKLANVQTYIQSGNVVFQAASNSRTALSKKIGDMVESAHGFRPQVLLLTSQQLGDAIQHNPYPEATSEPTSLHFFFLAEPATQADLAALEKVKLSSESYHLTDEVFYLKAPDGVGRSKLAAIAEKRLGVVTTARNYRTVEKLWSMVSAIACWLLLLCSAATTLSAQDRSPRDSARFRVVGYLPDYRQFDANVARQLTDLIVFSAEPTADGQLDLKRLDRVPWPDLQKAKQQHGLRLILCVGGWERSHHFSTMAGSTQSRAAFVHNAHRFCLDKQLDGIDLDWEHPQDPAQQQAYAQLLQELQQKLHPSGMTVSVTMAAWQVLPRAAFRAVDWVQIMAYDHPGRHATLEAAQADVHKLIDAGAPKNKLTLGLPFYGRGIVDANRTLTYREIVTKFHPAANVDEVDGVYFNGPATIEHKLRYAEQAGLAGIMVWEIGQDASGNDSLMERIHNAVKTRQTGLR